MAHFLCDEVVTGFGFETGESNLTSLLGSTEALVSRRVSSFKCDGLAALSGFLDPSLFLADRFESPEELSSEFPELPPSRPSLPSAWGRVLR